MKEDGFQNMVVHNIHGKAVELDNILLYTSQLPDEVLPVGGGSSAHPSSIVSSKKQSRSWTMHSDASSPPLSAYSSASLAPSSAQPKSQIPRYTDSVSGRGNGLRAQESTSRQGGDNYELSGSRSEADGKFDESKGRKKRVWGK